MRVTACGMTVALASRQMLRITITTLPQRTDIVLEGRLVGAWVDELAACWRGPVAAQNPCSVRIDLDAVTFIDAAGKALLRAMHAQGAVLVAKGVMTRAIVDEITAGAQASDRRLSRN